MFDVIAFDADDTLWHNEYIFINVQKRFCEMLSSHDSIFVKNKLSDLHIKNIKLYGYGIKGFVLSMIETLVSIRGRDEIAIEVGKILDFGREMLVAPIELIPKVFDVIKLLYEEYKLMVITKGDLLDQGKKISQSGLSDFFTKIEIVSEKNERSYKKILARYRIEASKFLMVGNSIRSDIVPVVQIGANAVHIPYKTTWKHEKVNDNLVIENFFVLKNIGLLPEFLKSKK